MKGSSRQVAVLGLLIAAMALAFAGTAEAKLIRKPLGAFGSAEQQSFANPAGLAVDQDTQELYVLSGGQEVQSLKVSATAGTFRLKLKGGETTADIAFDAPDDEKPGSVESVLEALPAIGAGNVSVIGGPGDATGSHPYRIGFVGALANTDLEQLSCENGATPLSGGSGCSVSTEQDGEPTQVTRWNADGTPSNFSALGSNAIDGQGPGEDQNPDNSLEGASYIAIDESGGATDGDIYVARQGEHVLDTFASSGKYLGQLTGFKEGPNAEGPLKLFSADSTNAICGVTVDEAGDLYVGETTVSGSNAVLSIHKYHPGANPVANADNVANFTAVGKLNMTSCNLAAGAGPSAGYIFSSGASGGGASTEIYKLDAATGETKSYLATSTGPLGFVNAIAVDPASGHVFAGTRTEVLEYDASGSAPPLPRYVFGVASEVQGLAASGASEDLYVASRSSPQIDVYGPPLVIPDVVTEAASELTGTSATLNGTIGAASGPGASCHFQYTTEAAYLTDKAIAGHDGFSGAPSAPCEPAGPFTGAAINAVSAEVTGLSPEAKYEFRIVGENANGESPGKAEPFETRGKPAIEGGLASEVTTTTAKISGEVNPRGLASTFAVQYVTQAEFEASGYAAATTTPEESAGSGAIFAAVSQKLSGLAPATTYHFRLIAKNEAGVADPGEDGTFTTFVEPSGLPEGRAYEQVSPPVKLGEVFAPYSGGRINLGGTCIGCTPGFAKGLMPMQVSPDGNSIAYEGNPFSPGLASGRNEYIAGRSAGGWATTPLSGPEYEDGGAAPVGFRAFSADLSRGVLYQAAPTLSPDAPPGYPDLYLWQAGGALTPLITSEPPNRSPSPSGANAFRLTYAGANAGTDSTPPFSHLVFQANDALTGEVPGIAPEAPLVTKVETETNVYEWSDGQLRLVNVLPGNNAAAPDAVIGSGAMLGEGAGDTYAFDHAISDDGSRVFWSQQPSGQVYVREGATSTTKVPDPGKFITATPDGAKVLLSNGHVFDLEDESTTDLTGGQGGFQGILGTSEDFSRIYFIDTEALTAPGEENANGEHAKEGEFNLYLAEEGATTFIGILLSGNVVNDNEGTNGAWRASSGSRTAQVSPDGRYLAFTSRALLTGYDNVRAQKGCAGTRSSAVTTPTACTQVFEYDAVQGSLACASCNPTGEAPLGGSNLALFNVGSTNPFPQPHNLPGEGQGRLFFESRDDLSAADTNGAFQDIYEWQPQGIGGCARPDGCITLISGGHGPEDSRFVDASPSGKDVFFATWEELVPFDKDDLMDLYDARVGGGFEFSAQEPCLGKACRGASSPAPEPQSPGTAGFSEAVSKPKPACKKGSVKKRGRCVTKKKKHHHKRAAKHNRGGAK